MNLLAQTVATFQERLTATEDRTEELFNLIVETKLGQR